jgi:hypothetical protein
VLHTWGRQYLLDFYPRRARRRRFGEADRVDSREQWPARIRKVGVLQAGVLVGQPDAGVGPGFVPPDSRCGCPASTSLSAAGDSASKME